MNQAYWSTLFDEGFEDPIQCDKCKTRIGLGERCYITIARRIFCKIKKCGILEEKAFIYNRNREIYARSKEKRQRKEFYRKYQEATK